MLNMSVNLFTELQCHAQLHAHPFRFFAQIDSIVHVKVKEKNVNTIVYSYVEHTCLYMHSPLKLGKYCI